jgi:hypothetical protein
MKFPGLVKISGLATGLCRCVFINCTLNTVAIILVGVYSCTLPLEWDGEWHDSSDTTQDITFTRSDNYVVGWDHRVFEDTVTSWTCVEDDPSNNLLLFQ